MKKIILLIAMLAISTVGLVGCNSGKTNGTDLSTPENVSETVQNEQSADCDDGDCGGDCKEPECPDRVYEEPDGENKIPEPPQENGKERNENNRRRESGRGHDHGCPKPRPMPRRPK